MEPGSIAQGGLRTPTGPFVVKFCIGFIPWAGQAVFDRAHSSSFRCTLDGSEAKHWLEIPSWMFDRASCARGHTPDNGAPVSAGKR